MPTLRWIRSEIPPEVADFAFWFGFVASAVTLVAGAIAIAGVVWAVKARAKLEVRPILLSPHIPERLTIAISSIGSNPVRDIELTFASLDSNGFSLAGGDGRRASLSRGETLLVDGFERGTTFFSDPPRDGEFRWPFEEGEGWFATIRWQSPLFPWTHESQTLAWSPARRFASELPDVLTGRAELAFLKRTRDPALNPLSPSFVPPFRASFSALVADDSSFDALLNGHKGVVVVGFGPSWQGKVWNDFKKVLDALAAKRGPSVRVLTVETDMCPDLAVRFDFNVVPLIKVFDRGTEVHTSTGARPLPSLERDLADHLMS